MKKNYFVKQMSKQEKNIVKDIHDGGIVCSPIEIMRSCGGVTAFLLTIVLACALSFIAGGSYWIARSLAKFASGENILEINLCCDSNNIDSMFCTESTPQCPSSHGTF